jgi:hypothetical protein
VKSSLAMTAPSFGASGDVGTVLQPAHAMTSIAASKVEIEQVVLERIA